MAPLEKILFSRTAFFPGTALTWHRELPISHKDRTCTGSGTTGLCGMKSVKKCKYSLEHCPLIGVSEWASLVGKLA